MRRLGWAFALLTLSAGAKFARAADADFNGRWDIVVHKPPAQILSTTTNAWWLEITGAGTPKPKVKLAGSPDGAIDDIPNARIQEGVLHYVWQQRDTHIDYEARYVGGNLEGSMSGPKESLTFVSFRQACVTRCSGE